MATMMRFQSDIEIGVSLWSVVEIRYNYLAVDDAFEDHALY